MAEPPDDRAHPTMHVSFRAPQPPTTLVRRIGLDQRLGPASGASWTLVVGPPGSGKTTLVRTWIDGRSEPWTWVGLTSAAALRPDVVDLLARAIQHPRPDVPLDLLDMLDMDEVEPHRILDRAGWRAAGRRPRNAADAGGSRRRASVVIGRLETARLVPRQAAFDGPPDRRHAERPADSSSAANAQTVG